MLVRRANLDDVNQVAPLLVRNFQANDIPECVSDQYKALRIQIKDNQYTIDEVQLN